jgi:peroxiredoxin
MLMKGQLAPDFELEDTTGDAHRLSSYRGEKVVVLAFLRGFM